VLVIAGIFVFTRSAVSTPP